MDRRRGGKNSRDFGRRPPARPSGRAAALPQGDLLIGRNSLREVLAFAPERVMKVFSAEGNEAGERDELIAELRQREIPVERVPRDTLSEMAESSAHQSFIAVLKPRPDIDFKVFLEKHKDQEQSLIVALDEIEDPHNVGAILRASECFGVDGLIISKNRGCQITPAVRKVSVGASELVDIIKVGNLVEALRRAKDAQYWIVGAAVSDKAVSIDAFEFPKRAVIVLGAEGEGMKRLVREQVDYEVFIPMHGRIDSLNVSQAAAVFLAGYRRGAGE